MSFEDLDVRKIYETNQLYQSDDPILINLAEKINEAEKYAFENCVIKDIPDYSVFADIETRNKEVEKKKEIKSYKKIFYEKMKEFEELKQNLEKLNNELNTEKEHAEFLEKLGNKMGDDNEGNNSGNQDNNICEIKFDEEEDQEEYNENQI